MSNEIARFNPEPMGQMAVMFEVEDGDYVNYEDYLLLLGKHNAVMRDLTNLEMVPRTEHDELLEENEKLKRLEGVVICDSDGNTLDWNIVEGVVEISACEDDK